MYGFMIEKSIVAKDVDAYNRSAIATVDIDGGNLVSLAAGTTAEAPWTATVPASAATGLWMAYNPQEALSAVNGQVYAGLSNDPRAYTNLANRPFTVFKPKKYDVIGFTKDCFDSTLTTSTAVGSYFGAKANQATMTCSSTALTGTSFQVISNGTLPFPAASGTVGLSQYQFVVGECVVE
jgi:hypothetical protein